MTPSDIEKSRKEFEEILLSKFPSYSLAKNSEGDYIDPNTYIMMTGWLARHGSITVYLPQRNVEFDCEDEPRYYYRPSQICAALKSAGINYRERE